MENESGNKKWESGPPLSLLAAGTLCCLARGRLAVARSLRRQRHAREIMLENKGTPLRAAAGPPKTMEGHGLMNALGGGAKPPSLPLPLHPAMTGSGFEMTRPAPSTGRPLPPFPLHTLPAVTLKQTSAWWLLAKRRPCSSCLGVDGGSRTNESGTSNWLSSEAIFLCGPIGAITGVVPWRIGLALLVCLVLRTNGG